MSRRVYFSHGSKDGALGHFLSAPLEEFRAWLMLQCDNNEEAWIEVETPLLPLLDKIMALGATAFLPETSEQARLLDLLIDHFNGWCEWEKTGMLGNENAFFTARRYEYVKAEIHTFFGDEAHRLWEFMLHGRAVGRPDRLFPYTPIEEGYPNSYWTYEEVGYLYYRMQPFEEAFRDVFGDQGMLPVQDVFRSVKKAFEAGVGLIIEIA